MKSFLLYAILLCCVALTACTSTQKGTSVGTLGGAALGAIIGHQSGERDKGAAIGAAAGALGGYVVGEKMKAKFCPVGGKHYDETLSYCPTHGVELQYKQ